jgi:hypothetical protein
MYSLKWGSLPRYHSDPSTCDHTYNYNDLNLTTYVINKTIYTNDFKNPVVEFLDKYSEESFFTNQGLNSHMMLGKMQIDTDEGTWISNFKKIKTVKPESYTQKPFPIVGSPFYTPAFFNFHIGPSNIITYVKRTYVSGLDVCAQIGGVMANLTQFFVLFYWFYNFYRRTEEIMTQDIMPNEHLYGEEYQFSKNFGKLYWSNKCCCKKTRWNSAKEEKLDKNFRACSDVLKQAMDVENYLKDSLEMQLLKGLFIKERHRMLMPLLAISTTRRKLDIRDADIKAGRKVDDGPTAIIDDGKKQEKMNIEEAVAQLKMGLHSGSVEGLVDQFFLDNLPTSAYRQKTPATVEARNPERERLRHSVLGAEMLPVHATMVRKPLPILSRSKSITGRRGSIGSNATQKNIQQAKKRESVLRGMINSAIYEIDQSVYGDNLVNTVDFTEKWRGDLVVMKLAPELAISYRKPRANTLRSTRLITGKSGTKVGQRRSSFTSADTNMGDLDLMPGIPINAVNMKSRFGETPDNRESSSSDGIHTPDLG